MDTEKSNAPRAACVRSRSSAGCTSATSSGRTMALIVIGGWAIHGLHSAASSLRRRISHSSVACMLPSASRAGNCSAPNAGCRRSADMPSPTSQSECSSLTRTRHSVSLPQTVPRTLATGAVSAGHSWGTITSIHGAKSESRRARSDSNAVRSVRRASDMATGSLGMTTNSPGSENVARASVSTRGSSGLPRASPCGSRTSIRANIWLPSSSPLTIRLLSSFRAQLGSSPLGSKRGRCTRAAFGTKPTHDALITSRRAHAVIARMLMSAVAATAQRRRVRHSSLSLRATYPHSPQVIPGVPERSCQHRGQRRARALSPKSAHHTAPMPSAPNATTSTMLETRSMRTLLTQTL